jgi:hypothetical protein
VLVGLVMDAVEVGAADEGAGLDVADAPLLRERAVGGGQAERPLDSASEHVGIFGELRERRRRDEDDARRTRAGAGFRA